MGGGIASTIGAVSFVTFSFYLLAPFLFYPWGGNYCYTSIIRVSLLVTSVTEIWNRRRVSDGAVPEGYLTHGMRCCISPGVTKSGTIGGIDTVIEEEKGCELVMHHETRCVVGFVVGSFGGGGGERLAIQASMVGTKFTQTCLGILVLGINEERERHKSRGLETNVSHHESFFFFFFLEWLAVWAVRSSMCKAIRVRIPVKSSMYTMSWHVVTKSFSLLLSLARPRQEALYFYSKFDRCRFCFILTLLHALAL